MTKADALVECIDDATTHHEWRTVEAAFRSLIAHLAGGGELPARWPRAIEVTQYPPTRMHARYLRTLAYYLRRTA